MRSTNQHQGDSGFQPALVAAIRPRLGRLCTILPAPAEQGGSVSINAAMLLLGIASSEFSARLITSMAS